VHSLPALGAQNPKPQTHYELYCDEHRVLEKEVTEEYFNKNGRKETITTEKEYSYGYGSTDRGGFMKPRRIETTNSDNTIVVDSLDYLLNYPAIVSRHKRMEKNSWQENQTMFKPGTCLPEKVVFKTSPTMSFQDAVLYKAYDSYGNVNEIVGRDNVPKTILWSYNYQYPVIEVVGATLSEVKNILGASFNIESFAGNTSPETLINAYSNTLRNANKLILVTAYTYKPMGEVASVTDPQE